MKNPRVFISHSHQDRAIATKIQSIIVKKGAETFLDQDKIQISDSLPARLLDGISWCDILLLIWSRYASSSQWVTNEWKMAYDYRKKIIPYAIDNVPLRNELSDLVYISYTDMEHANVYLLKSIFGEEYAPGSSEIFPGQWELKLNAFGMGTATYMLNLRTNGQITGDGKIDAGGLFGSLLQGSGMGNFLNMSLDVNGSWSYVEKTKILTIRLQVVGFGRVENETINIFTTGRETGDIKGQDFSGRTYVIRRLN